MAPYSGIKLVAHFSIGAHGGSADQHLMPAHHLAEILIAASNITRRTTLLCMARPHPSVDDIANVNVMVQPPARGSFLIELAVGVGTNIAANVLTPPALSGITHISAVFRSLWLSMLGQPEAELDSRIEPYFASIIEVAEQLHPSAQILTDPIGQSVERLDFAAGITKTLAPPITLDSDAKAELSREIVSPVPERFYGRVRQLNDRTKRGLYYGHTVGKRAQAEVDRSLRFWIDSPRDEARILAAFSQNLASNNRPGDLFADIGLGITAVRVTTPAGRTKRLLVKDVGM